MPRHMPDISSPAVGVTAKSAPGQRGRPRDPERLRRILDVARNHFYAHGFERANLDAIASDAGVSKMTVYSHFTSKESLFEAVIGLRTDGVIGSSDRAAVTDASNPEATLMKIGIQFLSLIRDPNTLNQFRTLFAAAATQPDACMAFYRQGADRLITELASYLSAAHTAGALCVPKPRQAADMFLAMFMGDGHICGLLRLPMPSARTDKMLLGEAVRVFIAAFGRH